MIRLDEEIAKFQPQTEAERQTKDSLLRDKARLGSRILLRESENIHLTVGCMVLDPSMQFALMVRHALYGAFGFPGGHVDGEVDLLAVARREIEEETGVHVLWPLEPRMLSLCRLPVPRHRKEGDLVNAHEHYVAIYGFVAPMNQKPAVNLRENTAVEWIAVAEIGERCAEAHMIPLYRSLCAHMWALKEQKEKNCQNLLQLIPWYERHARDLPWRMDTDPYHVWLSEIMLQQTRVEAAKAYYTRFVAELPDIKALAEAPQDRLLKLWEGLGYYSRVRNLQRAAKQIVKMHAGQFPSDYAQIQALPGIGAYTAGAIASICFEQRTPAVDGNVLRVAARLMEDFEPIDRTTYKKRIHALLKAVYPAKKCGVFTQSLMELGATVCVPNGVPKCEKCPLRQNCLAAINGTTALLPIRQQKKPRDRQQKTVFLLRCRDQYAVRQRESRGLLAGCWEFPNVEGQAAEEEALQLLEQWGLQPRAMLAMLKRTHIFTHIQWDMTGYYIRCEKSPPDFHWATFSQIEEEIALPSAFKIFWDDCPVADFVKRGNEGPKNG